MPSSLKAFALTAALTLVAGTQAHAQSISFNPDIIYDYDLYAAEWETNWYTIVLWDDGTVSEYGSYSQQGAQNFAIWLYLHIVEVRDIDIISRVEPGEWQFVGRFGTRAAAEDVEDDLQADGLATDIRLVPVTLNYADGPYLHRYPSKIYPTEPAPKG